MVPISLRSAWRGKDRLGWGLVVSAAKVNKTLQTPEPLTRHEQGDGALRTSQMMHSLISDLDACVSRSKPSLFYN